MLLGWGEGGLPPHVIIQAGNLIWRNTLPLLSATWFQSVWALMPSFSQCALKETSEHHKCRASFEKHPAGPWGKALIRINQTPPVNNSCTVIIFRISFNSRNVGVKWALWRLKMLAVVSRNKFGGGVIRQPKIISFQITEFNNISYQRLRKYKVFKGDSVYGWPIVAPRSILVYGGDSDLLTTWPFSTLKTLKTTTNQWSLNFQHGCERLGESPTQL